MRPLLAAAAVAGLVLFGAVPAQAEESPDSVQIGVTVPESTDVAGTPITNAELRWGLNRESSSGAYFGGCNFLSAGVAADAGSAHVWTADEGLYSASSGAVSVVKATAGGGWEPATFDTKCLDTSGAAVSVTSVTASTQTQVVIDGGTGASTADGGVSIAWRGSFSVVFYGGLTYWSASDPQLTLDGAGDGQLTATASGYGSSMDDPTLWVPLEPRTVVLAELRGVTLAGGGFVQVPEYLGVAVADAGQTPRTTQNAAYWGSFPASYLAFQKLTGQGSYWLTSGGARDPAKPATLLTVNYDADAPAFVPPTEGGLGGTAQPDNPVTVRPGTAAAAAAAAAAAGYGSGSPVSIVRDRGTGLVPDAVVETASPFLLPLGGALLAALVSILAILHLNGRLALPWRRPTAG